MLSEQPFDIPSLHAAYELGLSPVEVVDECYRRLEAVGDPGIFLHLTDREALRTEAASLGDFDPVGKPLWGVPFVVKDNIDTAGAPTTAACPEFTYPAEQDAFVVESLRQAGALLLGKTNLDQFATGLVGVRTPYPVPRNALDPQIVPGGSSSGSAVAVAHGIVSFSLGTDTAGSGRVPAALNGIVGLKPTLGALSNTGVVPACRSLDTVSIFALTVRDAYSVFRVAAVFDAADGYARHVPTTPLAAAPPVLRVGVPDEASRKFFGDDVQATAFAASLERIAALGGEVVEMDFSPLYEVAALLYQGAWVAERYVATESFLQEHPEAMHPVTRQIIEAAEQLTAADAFRDLYRLQDLKRAAEPLLEGADLLCVPSMPTFYTVSEVEADPFGPNTRLGTYTNFVNLMDLCGIAVPVSRRNDGRPGSVTLLATAGRDAQVAAFADLLQRDGGAPLGATGWSIDAVAALPDGQPADDEIAVAVVGAHMSGLPLNAELTRLGARFLRETETASCYRLYRLRGGPPFRPGLVRDETGRAIRLEVWAMPASAFGDFLRNIPAPLGIGTLMLADGESVKGFLCEHSGLVGAQDITGHGGWRAYLQSL